MPRTIVDLPTDYFNRGAWLPTRQPICAHLDSRPAVVLAIKPRPPFVGCSPVPSQMLRGRSRALFRLLLLPPALDRPCNLLVLLSHLGEAVLPQALRSGVVPLRRLLLARLLRLVLGRHRLPSRGGGAGACEPSGNDAARRCSGGDAVPRQRQFTPTHAP